MRPWRTLLLASSLLLLLSAPALGGAVPGLPQPTSAPAIPGALAWAGGWPMFHGNSSLDGVASTPAPLHTRLLWQIQVPVQATLATNSPPYQSSPVVVGPYVVLTSGDELLVLNSSTGASVVAVDLTSLLAGGSAPYVATPTVLAGGEVAIAQGGGGNNVAIFSLATGKMINHCNAGGAVIGSPVPINSRTVAVPTFGGNVYGPVSATACGANWAHTPGGAQYTATGSVGWTGNLPHLAFADQANGQINLYSVAGATYTANVGVPATPQGSVAMTNLTNRTLNSTSYGFIGDTTPLLLAFNLTSQNVEASMSLAGGILGTPAVRASPSGTSAAIFFGNGSNLGRATFLLTPSGPFLHGNWNFTVNGTVSASPAIAGNLVIDADQTGTVYALDAVTGAEAWAYRFPGEPIYASPAVANGMVYVLTSTGTLAALAQAAPPATLTVQSPIPAGTTVPVNVSVAALNYTGVPTGGLGGAAVSLSVDGGTLVGPSLRSTNPSGWVQFNWSAPAQVSSSVNVTFVASVSATGYGATQATGVVQVNPSSTPPSSSPYLLLSSVVAGSSAVPLGQSTWVGVTARSSAGAPLPSAVVQLALLGAGTLSTTFGTTAGNGTFMTTYTAPLSAPANLGVLVEANVSLTGYTSSQNATVLEIQVPTGGAAPSTFALTVDPNASLTVPQGGTISFQVVVANGSSTSHPPVAGAAVSVVGNPSTLGTITGSATTSAFGIAYYNFTSGGGTGSLLVLVQVQALGYQAAGTAMAVAILPASAILGTLHLTVSATPPFYGGSLIALNLSGTAVAPAGNAFPAAGATVVAAVAVGTGSLTSTSVVLTSGGWGPALGFNAPTLPPGESVVLSFVATLTGYTSASVTMPLALVPPPLALSPSFGSATLTPGSTSQLTVVVLASGITVSGAWVNASVSEAGPAQSAIGPSRSALTQASGVASFQVYWAGPVGQTVTLEFEASARGYASAWSNLTLTLVAPTSSTSTGSASLSTLDLSLLALVILFAVLFVVALFRRRRPPAEEAPSHPDEEAPTPPPDLGPQVSPGPPAGASAAAAVPAVEFDEEVDHHETHPVGTATETVDRPGPPEEESAPAQDGGEPTIPVVVEEVEEPTEAPTEPAHEEAPASAPGEGAGPATEASASTGSASAPDDHVHVHLERTIGEERPSVEEASPFGEDLTPEEVNPNVRRIPKKLLQPAEMRISGDEKAGDQLPEAEEAERRRQEEARTQRLMEKSRRLKRAQRQESPPPEK